MNSGNRNLVFKGWLGGPLAQKTNVLTGGGWPKQKKPEETKTQLKNGGPEHPAARAWAEEEAVGPELSSSHS